LATSIDRYDHVVFVKFGEMTHAKVTVSDPVEVAVITLIL
jgi:hypothetical protein